MSKGKAGRPKTKEDTKFLRTYLSDHAKIKLIAEEQAVSLGKVVSMGDIIHDFLTHYQHRCSKKSIAA